ncbi:MAG: hypothetical protein HQL75_08270 [Magnetococcales bacterium]|nr:hypothetical protein [Magnetococcales bacterium]
MTDPSGFVGGAIPRFAGVFFLGVATVFIALAFFVWPSSDDFNFAHSYRSQSLVTCRALVGGDTVAVDFPCHRYYSFDHPTRHATLFELAANEYLTFVGRYFTNLLAFGVQGTLLEIVGTFHLYQVYPMVSWAMMLLFFGAAWFFARQWGYTDAILSTGGLAWGCLGFVVLYMQHMPHLASSFYQISQLLMHQTCNALSLMLLGVLLWHRRSREGGRQRFLAVVAASLTVAVMGSSEIILFWNGVIIFIVLLLATWRGQKNIGFYRILFVLASLGACAVVFAPGTLSRIGETSSQSMTLWTGLQSSLLWSMRYMVSWSLSPVLWIMTFWMLPYAQKVVRQQGWFDGIKTRHVLVFLMVWVGMIWASWFLLAGIGREMPMRVINGIYFYFLVCWFLGVHGVLGWLPEGAIPKWLTQGTFRRLLPVLLCVALVLPGSGFLQPPNNFLQAIDDLRGPLWVYRQQQLQRLERIRAAVDLGLSEVMVPPFTFKPKSVFYEDILPDRGNNWRNRHMGAFYGLVTVHLGSAARQGETP